MTDKLMVPMKGPIATVTLTLLSCCLLASLASAQEKYRSFTDVFGQKTEARIVKVERGHVYLEDRKGTKSSMSLKALPDAEQKVVRDWMKSGGQRRMPAGSGRVKPHPKPSKRPASESAPKPAGKATPF